MARHRLRSEVVVAIGLATFIAIALVKPWGPAPGPRDARPSATNAAIASAAVTAIPGPLAISTVTGGSILATTPVSGRPGAPTELGDGLWYPVDGGRLARIDSETTTATDIVLDPEQFTGKVGLVELAGVFWLSGAADRSLTRFDPDDRSVGAAIHSTTLAPTVVDEVFDIASDGASLWFTAAIHATEPILIGTPIGSACCDRSSGTALYRADPTTGQIVKSRDLHRPLAMATGFDSIWVLDQPSAGGAFILNRLRPATGAIMATLVLSAEAPESSRCGACLSSFAVGRDSVWVPTGLGATVQRIDPTINRIVATIDIGRDVEWITAAPNGAIWVAGGFPPGATCQTDDGFVAAIDPSTNAVRGVVPVACPVSVAAFDGDLWVGTDGPGGSAIVRIHPTP